MATATIDPTNIFLRRIGAARLDPNGRPQGSTGGAVSLNQDDEAELAALQQIPQRQGTGPYSPAPAASAQAAANPMDKLNRVLGLNLGNPTQNMATRQATDSLPAMDQVGAGLAQNREQIQAAQMAERIAAAGGMPDTSMPAWQQAQQQRTAEAIYNQMAGGSGVSPGGAFMQPSSSYAPTGLRSRAINAGGAEVAGYGGAMASATQKAGGGTAFTLRQGQPQPSIQQPVASAAGASGGPSAAAMQVLQGGQVPDEESLYASVTPSSGGGGAPQGSGQRVSAIDQAQQRYQQAVASTGRQAKSNIPAGYEANPDEPGAIRPIKGSKDDRANIKVDAAKEAKFRQEVAQSSTIIGTIDDLLGKDGKRINPTNAGVGGTLIDYRPGTDAYDIKAGLDTIKALVGFRQLQKMRESSPTGGALGNITERELAFLQSVEGSLDQKQSPERLRNTLQKIRNSYSRLQSVADGINPDEPAADGQAKQPANAPAAPIKVGKYSVTVNQ